MRHTRALKSKLKTLSIKVPRATSAKVARLAKERHQTVSAIVRDAIDAYPEGPQAGSFAERARRHLGVFAGPGDLSTNPKHLVGFGAWRR